MALTDAEIRKLNTPGAKKAHGDGLSIYVSPKTGAKLWIGSFRHKHTGRQGGARYGQWPGVAIADAVAAHAQTRAWVAEGKDPAAERARAKLATGQGATFGEIGRELYDKKVREGLAERTLAKESWLLALAAPLHKLPVASVTAPEILAVLRMAEARGNAKTAERLRGYCGQVIRYACATGRATADPSVALKGAVARTRVQHRPAIIDRKAFGALLCSISVYDGTKAVKRGLELLARLACRPGEIRHMLWSEIDFDAACWSIPEHKTKQRRAVRIPLSRQVVSILRDDLSPGSRSDYVLEGFGLRPLSSNTLNVALVRMGFRGEACPHGFRSTFASMATESGLWSRDAVERSLGHVEHNQVRQAYVRSDLFEERRRLAQWWSDEVDAMMHEHFVG